MANVINYLAAGEGEALPLEGQNSVLLPANYDIVWSLVIIVVIGLLVLHLIALNLAKLPG